MLRNIYKGHGYGVPSRCTATWQEQNNLGSKPAKPGTSSYPSPPPHRLLRLLPDATPPRLRERAMLPPPRLRDCALCLPEGGAESPASTM